MIRLILARHGNTFEAHQTPVQIGARTDLPLTAHGRKQAEWLANFLTPPVAIYAGPLKRQTEFAQIIASRFHLNVLTEPALTEIDYGPWEGLPSEEISQKWPQEYAEWTQLSKWPQPIFKSTRDDHLRALHQWIHSLRKTYPDGATIIAISSNGLLRLLKAEKVKTGHFCELHLFPHHLEIKSWNTNPQDAILNS